MIFMIFLMEKSSLQMGFNQRKIKVHEIIFIFISLKSKIMKKTIINILILFLINFAAYGQTEGNKKKDPAGSWKFESANAPEEYSSGTIIISFSEDKYSTTMSFTGMEYKFIGENVRVVQDSIFFSVYIEDEDVKVSLKQEKASKMAGKAVYSDGVVFLNLTKEPAEAKKK